MNATTPWHGRWWDHAACRGMDTNLFFPDTRRNGPAQNARTRAALDACAHCPVRIQCAREAERTHATGIWGGINRAESTFRRTRADTRGLTL